MYTGLSANLPVLQKSALKPSFNAIFKKQQSALHVQQSILYMYEKICQENVKKKVHKNMPVRPEIPSISGNAPITADFYGA